MTEPGSSANRDENPLRPDSEAAAPESTAAESIASETPDSVTPDAVEPNSATPGAVGSDSEVGSAAEQSAGVPGGDDAGRQDNGVSGNGGEVPPTPDAQNWAGGYPVSGFGAQAPQGAPGYAPGQNMTPGGVPGYGFPPQGGQPGTPGYPGTQPGYAGYLGSGAQPPAGYVQPGYSASGGYPGYGVLPSGAVSPKSKVAGALLAFFLGIFGAHNFYFGVKGRAIAQLSITLVGFALFILGLGLATAGTEAYETYSSYGYHHYEDNDAMVVTGVVMFLVSASVLFLVSIWAFVEFILVLVGAGSYARDKEGRVIQ